MNKEDVFNVVMALSMAFLFGVSLMGTVLKARIDEMRQEAIDHGFAQRNPVTGEWEWKEQE